MKDCEEEHTTKTQWKLPQWQHKVWVPLWRKSSCGDENVISEWVREWVIKFNSLLGEWVSEWLSLRAFWGMADIGVHVVQTSLVIIAYTLGSFSSLTQITHNLQDTINFTKKSEWVIIFNCLSGDSGQWGPYIPCEPCNHSLYIGIIIFPHIDNAQSTGHN